MGVDERKQRVLEAVVALYAAGGEPVGSSLLCRYFDMAVSSATLRNEMAALTRLGLLEQPHTSAGRVPSSRGYRYYLDNLLDEGEELSQMEKRRIAADISGLDFEPRRLAQSVSRMLNENTGYAALVTTPAAEDLCIAHFEVVQVGRYSAAVLAVTTNGDVRTRVARVSRGLTRADAARLAGLLNSGLTFLSPIDLTPRLLAGFAAQLAPESEVLMPVVLAAAALLQEASHPEAYFEGAECLLAYPELQPYLGVLLRTFRNGKEANRLFGADHTNVQVVLGEDMEPAMPGLCIMSRRYIAGGGLSGTIALVGTPRMPFRKMKPRLDYFAQQLSQSMSGKNLQEDN